MKFSVLMSVYKNDNQEHFRLALESVSIHQIIKPAQIVIVQDGIVDSEIDKIIEATRKIESAIEFTVLKKKNNQGLAAALNDGISLCKYEYVARMDADDISDNRRFLLQTRILENDSSIDVLGGYIAEFEDDYTVLGKIRTVGKAHNEIVKMAKHRSPFNHMTVMYKKSKVLAIGGYNVEFGKLEDYCLWVDMISRGGVLANIPEILCNVRIGNGFIERRSNKEEIKNWDKLQAYMIEKGIILKSEAVANKIYIRVFSYSPTWVKGLLYKYILRK